MEDLSNKYIRFDWAMKRLLRDKANFGVLEGFLTTLLNEEIKINKLLESESNQEDEFDKQNRVDLLAENDKGELFLIEVQNNSEYAYFQRMLFGTSKLVTEYINRGTGYGLIRKIYSINIVYFNLGNGTDVVYHGKTEFRGIHNGELLNLSPFQKQKFNVDAVSDLYPEYYILKVNDFNKWSKVPLEQWIYFLNTGNIPADATAPGLGEAREKLGQSENPVVFLLPFPILPEQEEWNVSHSPKLTSESLHFCIERFRSGIGLPVHEKVKYGIIVICKSVYDSPECIPRQLFNFIEPSCQFGSCHILGAFPVEDVRQFHGKLIGPLQLGIKLEDDVRSPSLCLCPFGLVLGEDVFGPCQQLFARVTVRIPERDVLYALFAAFPHFLVLQVPCHPT